MEKAARKEKGPTAMVDPCESEAKSFTEYIAGLYVHNFCFSRSGWRLKICISIKFLGDTDVPDLEPHFESNCC